SQIWPSRLRQECLNASWFLSMEDARTRINGWRYDYTETRSHKARTRNGVSST
ncbi:MAG: integrase core domain-containing protein, partial [Pseudomonadota bacterium]